jgi:hypothetical protein
MSTEQHFCEMNNPPDKQLAKFVFRQPDGSEHYICEIHDNEYSLKNPKAVKSLITA